MRLKYLAASIGHKDRRSTRCGSLSPPLYLNLVVPVRLFEATRDWHTPFVSSHIHPLSLSVPQTRIMAVHSLHIFDRNGRTLYTKRYATATTSAENEDPEQLSDQRKLVFGMIFSLREITKMLAPPTSNDNSGLHSVKTGASTLHNYETASGLRFALYTAPTTGNPNSGGGNGRHA